MPKYEPKFENLEICEIGSAKFIVVRHGAEEQYCRGCHFAGDDCNRVKELGEAIKTGTAPHCSHGGVSLVYIKIGTKG